MIIAVLQARFSSTRLPGKVLKPILGKPMLALEIERIQRSKAIDQLLVATSTDSADDALSTLCRDIGVSCARGSLHDVLDRFYTTAEPQHPDHVVRLTGDCPLIDPAVIDATIDFYLKGSYDYVSNCQQPYTFPDGLDTEIFRFSALETAWKEAHLPSEREHVTPFIKKHPERFIIGHYRSPTNFGHLRWTVDEPEDFELVTKVYETLYPGNPRFTMRDILSLLDRKRELMQINNRFTRNEGSKKSLEEDRLFLARV